MSGTDLEVTAPPSITALRRNQFSAEQVDLIRVTVAKDCNAAELALFLETCARHELDPFIKEVWAIKMTSSSGVQTVVSRDGLLKVANRCTGKGWAGQPGEFLGCQSGVVHEHDHFDTEYREREDGTIAAYVEHSPRNAEGKPTFGGAAMTGRGEMVGAWARVRRRGHDDVLFIAPREEYDKKAQVWKSHPHAMMAKVAEAMALRKAFSIAGVVGEGELDRVVNVSTGASGIEAATEEIVWPEDEELAKELQEAFRALGYRRAKVRALVNACTEAEDYRALLARLSNEADAGEDIPEAEVVG